MKKFLSLFIVLFLGNSFLVIAATPEQSLLKEQYQHFKNNLQLIKQCYFTKSSVCTSEEKKKALYATIQIGIILAIAVGGGFGIKHYWTLHQLKATFLRQHGEGNRELLHVLKPLIPTAIRASVNKEPSFLVLYIAVPHKSMWEYSENKNLLKEIVTSEYIQKHFPNLEVIEFESFEDDNASVRTIGKK